MTTVARQPLTRDRIIDAALVLVDERGLGVLSMRKLGAALDVEAMSLYNHVANKDDVLDGIVGRLMAEVDLPHDSQPWQQRMHDLALSFRRVGLAHPGAFLLLGNRPVRTFDGFAPLECAFAILRQAGLEGRTADDAFHAAAAFVIGFVQMEISGLYDRGEDAFDLATLPTERFPNLVALGQTDDPHQPETQFDIGIDVLIAGLVRLVERTTP